MSGRWRPDVHSIERAKKVGSVGRIISPGELRRYLVEAAGRGIGRTKQAQAPKGLTADG